MAAQRATLASGVILRSTQGRVLMVQTHNRHGAGLILPGGLVDDSESPEQAARREVQEELGIEVVTLDPLVVEHHRPDRERLASLHWVFCARELIDEEVQLRLEPAEIADALWVEWDQIVECHVPRGRRRIEAAMNAIETSTPVVLQS